MDQKIRNILNCLVIVVIIVSFFVANIWIDIDHKHRLSFVSDGASFCYDIDALEMEEGLLAIKGWFLELKKVQGKIRTVSEENSEMMFILVPTNEAIENQGSENAVFMNVEKMHDDRPDVNNYLSCEYDYTKCGFWASINLDDIDLELTSYRLAIKPDANMKNTILTNVFVSDKGLSFTNPAQTPQLDTENTDLDEIVNGGKRLVSRPDIGCYVYQYGKKLYWIADENFYFRENGRTYIEYQMNTTQVDNLPLDRLELNRFWSDISGCFEDYEITNKIKCGKYRVMMREIPEEYSITNIITGYYQGGWLWKSEFRPCYKELQS